MFGMLYLAPRKIRRLAGQHFFAAKVAYIKSFDLFYMHSITVE